MEYLFIDFENVSGEDLADLGDRKVFLFTGEKKSKIDISLVKAMHELKTKPELIQMKGQGKNALDFHIAYYLGKCAEIDPKGVFKIFSGDSGFDPLIRHLKSCGIDCTQTIELPAKAIATPSRKRVKKSLHEMVAEFSDHLEKISEKVRPKKEAKLRHSIQNHFHEEENVVDGVLKGLVAKNRIVIKDGKVTYPFS
jgi:hypothetical protein